MPQKFKEIKAKADGFIVKRKNDLYATMAAATTAALTMPVPAFAETADGMLTKVLGLASTAVSVVGGALVAWGAVKFGLAIKDHQGGNAMAESLATIGGGAVIMAAAIWFKSVNDGLSFS